MLANTAGAVLAVIGYADWIAVTVAIASTSMAFIDYFYIAAQLASTNRALERAHNLLIWWDSLSLVQRKKRTTKLNCVQTVEGALLDMCSARTGVSAALPSEQQTEDDGEEEK